MSGETVYVEIIDIKEIFIHDIQTVYMSVSPIIKFNKSTEKPGQSIFTNAENQAS